MKKFYFVEKDTPCDCATCRKRKAIRKEIRFWIVALVIVIATSLIWRVI